MDTEVEAEEGETVPVEEVEARTRRTVPLTAEQMREMGLKYLSEDARQDREIVLVK